MQKNKINILVLSLLVCFICTALVVYQALADVPGTITVGEGGESTLADALAIAQLGDTIVLSDTYNPQAESYPVVFPETADLTVDCQSNNFSFGRWSAGDPEEVVNNGGFELELGDTWATGASGMPGSPGTGTFAQVFENANSGSNAFYLLNDGDSLGYHVRQTITGLIPRELMDISFYVKGTGGMGSDIFTYLSNDSWGNETEYYNFGLEGGWTALGEDTIFTPGPGRMWSVGVPPMEGGYEQWAIADIPVPESGTITLIFMIPGPNMFAYLDDVSISTPSLVEFVNADNYFQINGPGTTIQNCAFEDIGLKISAPGAVVSDNEFILNEGIEFCAWGGGDCGGKLIAGGPIFIEDFEFIGNSVDVYYGTDVFNSSLITDLIGTSTSVNYIQNNYFTYHTEITDDAFGGAIAAAGHAVISGNYISYPEAETEVYIRVIDLVGRSDIVEDSASFTVENNTIDFGGVDSGSSVAIHFADVQCPTPESHSSNTETVTGLVNNNIIIVSGKTTPVVYQKNCDNTSVTFSYDYNDIISDSSSVEDWGDYTYEVSVTNGANNLYNVDPIFMGDTLELAPMSLLLDVNGTDDIGAYSAERITTIYIDDDAEVDYETVHANNTDIIESLRSGDTVYIADGTYNGGIVLEDKNNMTITGAGETTIIDAPLNSNSIYLNNSDNNYFENMLIQGATDTNFVYSAGYSVFTYEAVQYTTLGILDPDNCPKYICEISENNTDVTDVLSNYPEENLDFALIDDGEMLFALFVKDSKFSSAGDIEAAFEMSEVAVAVFIEDAISSSGSSYTYNEGLFLAAGVSIAEGSSDPFYISGEQAYYAGIKVADSISNAFENVEIDSSSYGFWVSGSSSNNAFIGNVSNSSIYDVYSTADSDGNMIVVPWSTFEAAQVEGTAPLLLAYSPTIRVMNGEIPIVGIEITISNEFGNNTRTSLEDGYLDEDSPYLPVAMKTTEGIVDQRLIVISSLQNEFYDAKEMEFLLDENLKPVTFDFNEQEEEDAVLWDEVPAGDYYELDVEVLWADWVEQPIYVAGWYGATAEGSPDGYAVLSQPGSTILYIPLVEGQDSLTVQAAWFADGDSDGDPDVSETYESLIDISAVGSSAITINLGEDEEEGGYTLWNEIPEGDYYELDIEVLWTNWEEQPIYVAGWYGESMDGEPGGIVILPEPGSTTMYVPLVEGQDNLTVGAFWFAGGTPDGDPDVYSVYESVIDISEVGSGTISLDFGEGGEDPIIPAISMESLGGGIYAGTVVDPINVEILVGEQPVTFKAASGTTFTTSEDWSGLFESVDLDLSAEISGLINSAILVEFNSGLNSNIMLSKPVLISFEYPGVVSLTNRVIATRYYDNTTEEIPECTEDQVGEVFNPDNYADVELDEGGHCYVVAEQLGGDDLVYILTRHLTGFMAGVEPARVVTRGSSWWNWLFGDQEEQQVSEEPVDLPSQKTEQPDKETKEFIKEEVKDKTVEEVIYMPFRPVQNLNLEKTALNEFVKIVKRLPAGKDWESIHFLAYGNAVTSRLTLRDRAGLLNDYNELFKRLPSTENDWSNLSKIYLGQKPDTLSPQKDEALNEFKNIANKVTTLVTPNESNFVDILAYRLRPVVRDLEKEKQALAIFTKVYKTVPGSSYAWGVLRAIAYALVK